MSEEREETLDQEAERPQDWYFTFGFSHEYPNCYKVFHGTYEEARQKMVRAHGQRWAFQYGSAEAALLKMHEAYANINQQSPHFIMGNLGRRPYQFMIIGVLRTTADTSQINLL